MLRLTAVLLACLYATMAIWGDPPEGDVVVARADSFSPALAGMGAAPAAEPETGLSEISARKAVEMALAAGAQDNDDVIEVAATSAPEEEAEEEGRFVYVTGSRVNLRRGPTTESAVVGTVSEGDRAEPLSDLDDSWVRIRTERGVEAWIYGRFISETPA